MIAYRAPTPEDGDALCAMAATAFAATFADTVDPAEMTAYLDTAYGPVGDMRRDLADPAIDWRVAFEDDTPIGYIKLSALALPYDLAASDRAMEVRQVYVTEAAKGTGVADALMHWAIDLARARAADELYLAVFDHNLRAIRFYTRHGFAKVGSFTFFTGAQAHEDGIWKRAL